MLGITDHGPGTLAAGTSSYFRSLTYAPKKRFGIELLFGVELNILDIDGHLDLNDELLGELDYAIASMHAQNYNSGTIAENTSAYLKAAPLLRPRLCRPAQAAAAHFGLQPEQIMPGNGSDENLFFALRAFCDADHPLAYATSPTAATACGAD